MRFVVALGLLCTAAVASANAPSPSIAAPPVNSLPALQSLSKAGVAANCDCSQSSQARSCDSLPSAAQRCACTNKAMRACSQRCGKPFDWSLLCRDAPHKRDAEAAPAPAPAPEPLPLPGQVGASSNLRAVIEDIDSPGISDRNRPAAIACGGARRAGCPRGQTCSVDPKTAASGFCTGSPCFLNGNAASNQLCPSDPRSTYKQICVRSPRQDGLEVTDAPGLCADPGMKCGPSYGGCPRGWACQTQPNGDGDPCRGDPGCAGLCMHNGSASWKRTTLRKG